MIRTEFRTLEALKRLNVERRILAQQPFTTSIINTLANLIESARTKHPLVRLKLQGNPIPGRIPGI